MALMTIRAVVLVLRVLLLCAILFPVVGLLPARRG